MADRRIPDWVLERYVLGELPPDELEQLKQRIEDDEAAQARIAALESSSHAILLEYPPHEVARVVRERTGLRRRRQRAWVTGLGAMVAVAGAMLLVALPDDPAPVDPIYEDGVRPKGLDPVLHVYLDQGGTAERLRDGTSVNTGDTLQLSYVAADRPHGVVLSIDGRGAVTLHHPRTADGDTHLSSDGETSLPFGYQLDDAPRFERFFLVTSDDEIATHAVLSAARQLAEDGDARTDALALPAPLEQTSITVRKP